MRGGRRGRVVTLGAMVGAAARTAAEPHQRANDRGFRCVKDL